MAALHLLSLFMERSDAEKDDSPYINEQEEIYAGYLADYL